MTTMRFAGTLLAAATLCIAGTVGAKTARPIHSAQSAHSAVAGMDYAHAVADPRRSSENRALDEGRKPVDVLAFSQVHAGETVADFAAGAGYYSELIAAVVGPKGQVIALNNPKYYKADAWDKLRAAYPNVGLIVAENADLAPRSVDVIFTHLVFHDLFLPGRDPRPVLANWFAAVRPGGRVIVADHRGTPGDTTAIAGTLHRIDPAAVTTAMIAAGFVPDGASTALQRGDDDLTLKVFDPQVRGKTDRFLLRFRRP